MFRSSKRKIHIPFLALGIIVAGAISFPACEPRERSSSGFHLPDGDAQRGLETFTELKCNACHKVANQNLSPPVADPPVPVVLGGSRPYVITDGQLVTSIIQPSYEVSDGYPESQVMSAEESRMANYNETITVEQLADLVAFLHSCYEVAPPAGYRYVQ